MIRPNENVHYESTIWCGYVGTKTQISYKKKKVFFLYLSNETIFAPIFPNMIIMFL